MIHRLQNYLCRILTPREAMIITAIWELRNKDSPTTMDSVMEALDSLGWGGGTARKPIHNLKALRLIEFPPNRRPNPIPVQLTSEGLCLIKLAVKFAKGKLCEEVKA